MDVADVALSNIFFFYNAASFLLGIILGRFSPLVYPDLTRASNVTTGDVSGIKPVLQKNACGVVGALAEAVNQSGCCTLSLSSPTT